MLKTFDVYFNFTNGDIVFSLLDSAYSFDYLIGAVNKMTLSVSGFNVNGSLPTTGAISSESLTTTGV